MDGGHRTDQPRAISRACHSRRSTTTSTPTQQFAASIFTSCSTPRQRHSTSRSRPHRALGASLIDGWDPPSCRRSVREHLRTGQRLEQPKPTTLVAAGVSFTASHAAYKRAHHALLANQISSISDGNYFERSEVWSDRG